MRRQPRDLWALFGDIRGYDCIDDAILSGTADIVRLSAEDISNVHRALDAGQLPPGICTKSTLSLTGMASCIDDVQELAWRANGLLGQPNNRLFAAQRLVSDKEMLYRLLDAQGVGLPERILAPNFDALERVLTSLDAPLDTVILKPLVGTESRGIFRPAPNASPSEVTSALRALDDVSADERVLVMPYIDALVGPREFCLDGIVSSCSVVFCALHEKVRIHERYPIHDRAMVTPPNSLPDQAVLEALLAQFGRAFPLDSFVFHLEVRVDKNGMLIPIDLSFRPGGGLIFRSVLEVYGIDLRLAHMYASLSLDDELARIASRGSRRGRSAAIAAVFSQRQAKEPLNAKLSAQIAKGPQAANLVTYDLSNISILSSASQMLKPDVGLCVVTDQASETSLAKLDDVARSCGLALCSEQETEPPAPLRRSAQQASVHQMFSSHAARTPEAIALAHGDRQMSFQALDAQSSAFASILRAEGVQLETPVGILLDRSCEAVIAMLAILKAGACYVPLDPMLPAARLSQMVADIGIRHIVMQGVGAVEWFDGALIDHNHFYSEAADTDQDVEALVDCKNLAYILFTSGSTGRPKAVAITHAAIVNLVNNQSYVDFDGATAILQSAPLSFDASTFEIWGALLNGKCCVLYDGDVPDAVGVQEAILRYRIDIGWFTASHFNMLVDEDVRALGSLRCVVAGGEALSPQHVNRFLNACPQTQLVNGYGPTETTTFACTHGCSATFGDMAAIPIGLPIANVEIEILDEQMRPTPAGAAGELYIGGTGIARGYVNLPALTAEHFVPHPRKAGARLYRTGDRVRRRVDGALEFLGRLDRQVKLRGYRVELDEIEHALTSLPNVQAATVALGYRGDNAELIASVEMVKGLSPTPGIAEIRAGLSDRLPRYMVPTQIDIHDRLALTTNGKRDRSQPAPRQIVSNSTSLACESACELTQSLAKIWCDVLDIETVTVTDDFFNRGGHSLSATRVVARIRERLGVKVGLKVLFENRSLEEFADAIRRQLAELSDELPPYATDNIEQNAGSYDDNRRRQVEKRLSALSDAQVSLLLNRARHNRGTN